MLWDAVTPNTTWKDPENEIVISGDYMRVHSMRGGKKHLRGVVPVDGRVVDSNVGGHFGPHLKFAGFDALKCRELLRAK